jgi:hypothetical protein
MESGEKFSNKELITIIIAVASFLFSFYTHLQLVELDKAQIVISQNEIDISSAGPPCPNGENYLCDVIDPVVKNIGKAVAEDVQVELFGCFLDGQVIYGSIAPGEEGNYGNSYIAQKDDICGSFVGRQFILIFQLSYRDSLENDMQHRFSFLQYQIGMYRTVDNKSALRFVISEDLQKMCSWLEGDLKRAGASKDLVDYINIRCNKGEMQQARKLFLSEDFQPLSFVDFFKILAGMKTQ